MECGELASLHYHTASRHCFNGAALVGVRRATCRIFPPPLAVEASTGPHSLECGEGEETANRERERVASTGPHSLECGETKPDAK